MISASWRIAATTLRTWLEKKERKERKKEEEEEGLIILGSEEWGVTCPPRSAPAQSQI